MAEVNNKLHGSNNGLCLRCSLWDDYGTKYKNELNVKKI